MRLDLNNEQLNAVVNGDGPMLVVAGAGSGKTRVLTYRVAYLLEEKNVHPYNILAITFTNKAAREMNERILALSPNSYGIWMCTFHSMCVRILRQDIGRLGYDKNFSIYSESEVNSTLKNILKELEMDEKAHKKEARRQISLAKEKGMSPKTYKENNPGYENYALVYEKYEDSLIKANALDFDDLLLKTVKLLVSNPDVLEKYQQRFKYILIDEFQDTNKIQYTLIKLLGGYHKNIFAVGDEDQSIYGWRGANIGNIRDFKRDFNIKILKLEQNYRSSGNIIRHANTLIKNNAERLDKNLWTSNDDGAKVEFKMLYSDREEASYVIRIIAQLIKTGCKYSDFAILVRANSLSRLFEENMALYGFPYKVYGGFKFYDRKEVKDAIAYLRIITNPRDNEAIMRVINFPKRGIGNKAIENLMYVANTHYQGDLFQAILNNEKLLPTALDRKISHFRNLIVNLINAENEMPLDKFITHLYNEVGFYDFYKNADKGDTTRIDNIDELANAIKQFVNANPSAKLSDFLQSVSLISDSDADDNGDYITIATVHSSKGLEFKNVFIVGLEDGIFPSFMSMENNEVEEERRVMYVAITRAEERLFLSCAKQRFRFNEIQSYMPSRFIEEMGIIVERDPVKREEMETFKRNAQKVKNPTIFSKNISTYKSNTIKPNTQKDTSKFGVGTKVRHRRFGQGTIISLENGNKAKITFDGLGIKEFNLDIAPIKVVGE